MTPQEVPGAQEQQPGRERKTEAAGRQRCCVGALYLSQASKSPTCVGFTHVPPVPVKVEQRDPSAEGWTSYQFMCLGHSLYTAPGAGEAGKVPYCEGIEVVVASQEQPQQQEQPAGSGAAPRADAAVAATASRVVAAAVQRQQQQHAQQRQQEQPGPAAAARGPAQRQQQQEAPERRPATWERLFNTIAGGSSDDITRFARRFDAVARRNAASMQRALGSAYASVVKPLADRLPPRE